MASLDVHDMRPSDAQYVGTCSHVGESDEIDASARRRLAYLEGVTARGARTLVATLDGSPSGFLYLTPSAIAPWGPVGEGIAVIPCLWVPPAFAGRGIGRALIEAAELAARQQGARGVATITNYRDLLSMPAGYLERLGYGVATRRREGAIMWKPFDSTAQPPSFMSDRYSYVPSDAPVTVDLFYTRFCLTSDVEAERVREVAAEFGGDVLLREHCADDPAVRDSYGVSRAIYVDGREIGWGYEAPREGLREAFRAALAAG